MAANMTEIEELKKNINDVFLITNGIIVCLMQCGFACLEAGAVRSKNTTNIVMQNVLDIFFSIVSYWLVGYALAYGEGNSIFGYTFWAGSGLRPDLMAHWFFQFVFAATAATIVSGAVAERCNFITYITYSVVITGFVYPLVSRWAWAEEGWLKQLGYQDFSGCGPVHLLAGVMSFVAAAFLGPRIGRFPKKDDDSPIEEIVGHSTALVGMGGMILITGFLSFNGGTLGTMTNPGDGATISKVVINTLMGGSGAAIIVLAGSRMGLFGAPCWSFTYTLNAALAGMVSTCGAVNTYAFWGSFVSGLTCGPIVMILHYVMLRLRIDDPLDAVAVHFGGGLWGLVTASLFSEEGLVYGMTKESLTIFAYRMVGAATIIVWTAITGCIMFGVLKYFGKLRVTPEEELAGLDISQHNEEGYPAEGWKKSPLQLTPQISVLPTSYLSQPVKDNVLFRGFRLHDENNVAASHGLHNYIKRSGLRKHRASVDVSALTGL